MRLEKEQFNQLSQLDRIEFRQKREAIERCFSSDFTSFAVILMTILISMALIILCITIFNGTEEQILIVRNAVIMTFFMGVGLFIFGFIVDTIAGVLKSKNLKELEKEYFTINIKTNKKQ